MRGSNPGDPQEVTSERLEMFICLLLERHLLPPTVEKLIEDLGPGNTYRSANQTPLFLYAKSLANKIRNSS